jgi:hypothetical protein
VAALHDDELAREIRASFPDTAEFAKIHRTTQISTHFLRKLYAGYGYKTLGDTAKSTFAGWASQYLGWKLSSGLQTSISYSDLEIILLPPKLKDLDETKARIQALIGALLPPAVNDDSNLDGADLSARIRHRRKRKHTFIDIASPDESNEVRLPFHKRRRDNSAVERAREGMRLLEVVDMVPINSILRAMGYGGAASKAAMAAGPAAAPGAAPAVAAAAPPPLDDDNAMAVD